jgi:DNA invertase Pin-like site-specific DNA recombinase
MKKGYSYIRFSTVEQRKGDSLRRQLEASEQWCQRHGVTLDTTITLHDLGVSAFTGQHRSNPDRYALAAFLELVQNKEVPKGSYLVIENLDRLTREHIRSAVKLFIDILEHGINIVTTSPERVFLHDSQDMTDILIAVVELSRGHGESARKSEIVGKAWRMKKERAHLKPVTAQCPHWLRLEGGKFIEIPDRVALVRRIYRMTRDGLGVGAICTVLNREGVKPFRGKIWQNSSVAKILVNRAVLGEYQPCKGNKIRHPEGDPVLGYYPQIINETDFYLAQ